MKALAIIQIVLGVLVNELFAAKTQKTLDRAERSSSLTLISNSPMSSVFIFKQKEIIKRDKITL